MTELILARHGETEWNRAGRFQGHADPPLNDLGRAQASGLAVELGSGRITALSSSPLRRALETAETIGAALGLAPVTLEALREVDVGSWQGLTRAEVEARFPEQYRRWLDHEQGWDDGETYEEMGARVVPALQELARRHPGERVLAVTHGGPIRAALAFAEGISHAEARRTGPAIGNCFVARFAIEDNQLRRLD